MRGGNERSRRRTASPAYSGSRCGWTTVAVSADGRRGSASSPDTSPRAGDAAAASPTATVYGLRTRARRADDGVGMVHAYGFGEGRSRGARRRGYRRRHPAAARGRRRPFPIAARNISK
jgi:hypothetical protein